MVHKVTFLVVIMVIISISSLGITSSGESYYASLERVKMDATYEASSNVSINGNYAIVMSQPSGASILFVDNDSLIDVNVGFKLFYPTTFYYDNNLFLVGESNTSGNTYLVLLRLSEPLTGYSYLVYNGEFRRYNLLFLYGDTLQVVFAGRSSKSIFINLNNWSGTVYNMPVTFTGGTYLVAENRSIIYFDTSWNPIKTYNITYSISMKKISAYYAVNDSKDLYVAFYSIPNPVPPPLIPSGFPENVFAIVDSDGNLEPKVYEPNITTVMIRGVGLVDTVSPVPMYTVSVTSVSPIDTSNISSINNIKEREVFGILKGNTLFFTLDNYIYKFDNVEEGIYVVPSNYSIITMLKPSLPSNPGGYNLTEVPTPPNVTTPTVYQESPSSTPFSINKRSLSFKPVKCLDMYNYIGRGVFFSLNSNTISIYPAISNLSIIVKNDTSSSVVSYTDKTSSPANLPFSPNMINNLFHVYTDISVFTLYKYNNKLYVSGSFAVSVFNTSVGEIVGLNLLYVNVEKYTNSSITLMVYTVKDRPYNSFISIPLPSGKTVSKVYVDGAQTDNYVVRNGWVTVDPLYNVTIELTNISTGYVGGGSVPLGGSTGDDLMYKITPSLLMVFLVLTCLRKYLHGVE